VVTEISSSCIGSLTCEDGLRVLAGIIAKYHMTQTARRRVENHVKGDEKKRHGKGSWVKWNQESGKTAEEQPASKRTN
jgi:hypothetical protein